MPPSFASTMDVKIGTGNSKGIKPDPLGQSDRNRTWLESDIAVVGTACKVPGADTESTTGDLRPMVTREAFQS